MPLSHLSKDNMVEFKMENGKIALLRPIRPEDEALEKEMFSKFSLETKRFRFFHHAFEATDELIRRFTHINHDREIAIITEVNENGKKKMAGVARLISDNKKIAEFAVVVADPWQRQGLGSKMTSSMIDIAKKRGIKKIYVDVLRDNYAMLEIFKREGFKIEYKEDICHAELEL